MENYGTCTGFPYRSRKLTNPSNIGGSISLPNLRPSFRKMPEPPVRSNQYKTTDVNPPTVVGSRFRSASSPASVMKRTSFFGPPRPQLVPIPSFTTSSDGYKDGSYVKNSSELIVGALRAGYAYFQRGLHYSDILTLVRSASDDYNSPASTIKLSKSLEKLVASGIVSKVKGFESYGEKAKDARYRLVIENPRVTDTTPTLMISGTKIEHNANVRFKPGQCLPGGLSHLSRPANQPQARRNDFVDNSRRSEPNRLYPEGIPYLMNRTFPKGPWKQVHSHRGLVEHPAPPASPTSTDGSAGQKDFEDETLPTFSRFESTADDGFNIEQVYGDIPSTRSSGKFENVERDFKEDTYSSSDYGSILERCQLILQC